MRNKIQPVVATLVASGLLALVWWSVSAEPVSAEDREGAKSIAVGGSTLRLGMTFAEAEAALAEKFDVQGMMPDEDRPELSFYKILPKGGSGKREGSFALKNGRLVSASRVYGWYSQDAPAGTVVADFRKVVQKLSGEPRGRAEAAWEGGGVDNTDLAVDVADGTLHLVYYDSPNGARTCEIYYGIRSGGIR